jgi:hypothetical protein
LNGKYIERRYYVIWNEVSRLYKRVAMSKGGFTGKGIFGSVPFFVVELRDGSSKEFAFKYEGDIDNLLSAVQTEHPDIPTRSEAAERRIAEAETAERERYLQELSEGASNAVSKLEEDREYLERSMGLSESLTSAAKQKRIADKLPLSFKLIGFAQHRRFNKTKAQEDWNNALSAMKEQLKDKPDFSIPAQYAHPIVINRIIRIIREGRAEEIAEAFKMMKSDLKALDNTVTVSQKEYDEIVKIKSLFLVCDYKDEI